MACWDALRGVDLFLIFVSEFGFYFYKISSFRT